MSRHDNYITLSIFQNIHEAYIIRDMLILSGIKATVMGEETVMNNIFYSDNLGGAKLRVPQQQLSEARQIWDRKSVV